MPVSPRHTPSLFLSVWRGMGAAGSWEAVGTCWQWVLSGGRAACLAWLRPRAAILSAEQAQAEARPQDPPLPGPQG